MPICDITKLHNITPDDGFVGHKLLQKNKVCILLCELFDRCFQPSLLISFSAEKVTSKRRCQWSLPQHTFFQDICLWNCTLETRFFCETKWGLRHGFQEPYPNMATFPRLVLIVFALPTYTLFKSYDSYQQFNNIFNILFWM